MRDWLDHRARSTPDETALVDADTGDEWTFADLDAAVEETAGSLAGLGVEAGDHVGVLMETRPAFVRLVFAVQRVGAVLVPLNARLAVPELAAQRDAADLTALVCEADTEADAAAAAGPVPVVSVDDPDHDAVATLDDTEPGLVDDVAWSLDDVQAIMFTSGTTGDPKAVTLTAGNFLASAGASAVRLGVLPDDRWLLCLSMYHMGGLSVVLRSVLYGTTVVLQREFDESAVRDAVAAFDVTGVSLVPTMLDRVLDAGDGPLADSLRFVLLGGAPASTDLLERCAAHDVPVCPTYGMTETASQVATARPDEAFDHPGTVGRPLFATDVTVVGEDGLPVPTGETGELVVSGPTVTPGYYADPEATADATGEYGFRTGDIGYRDHAGRLWVLNRREDRIVTGGENVHPGEVADVLREHPDVREVAVVGVEDPEWGERVAALVVRDDEEVTADDLQAFCEGRLAGYKKPRTVTFADAIPRTASGTVDREAVRDRLRAADS
ncbi:o-succinylbenzoate--CoA ligase [Halobacteriaceae archaeon GCM10025711]